YGCCIDPEKHLAAHQPLPFPLDRAVPWPRASGRHVPSAGIGARQGASRNAPNRVMAWAKGTALGSVVWSMARSVGLIFRRAREELAFCFDGYRFAKEFRFLVVGLGGVFDEAWGGECRDLYSIFRWTILARIAGTPVVCLSVGVEEVNTTLGKFFCKTALS